MLWGQSEWELLEQEVEVPKGAQSPRTSEQEVCPLGWAGDVVSRALWERPRVHVGMDEGLEGK